MQQHIRARRTHGTKVRRANYGDVLVGRADVPWDHHKAGYFVRLSTWLTPPVRLYRTLVSPAGNFGGSPVIYPDRGLHPGERLENNLQFPALSRGENDHRREDIYTLASCPFRFPDDSRIISRICYSYILSSGNLRALSQK